MAPPGRHAIDYFMDSDTLACPLATASVVREDASPPFAAPHRRCAHPKARLTPNREAPGGAQLYEASWGADVAEVRVRLRIGESRLRVGLVIGTEVVGLTKPVHLGGASRRFFAMHELFRSGVTADGPMQSVGAVRIALEWWPPGSFIPAEPDQESLRNEAPSSETLKHLCLFCDGLGRRPCSTCDSHGVLVCRACDGMPTIACSQCNGQGVVHGRLEAISYTYGTKVAVGGQQCTACWGGSRDCTACFGMRALRCSACAGAGWTPCTRCASESRTVQLPKG